MSSRSPSPQFTPQESGSDFASIVDTDLVTPWAKLNGKDRLARWHKKHWDKSMAIEERAWLSTQPHVPRDEDADGTDTMDVDVPESIDEDSEMEMETETEMDDDYISGCYLLNVRLLMNRKIWIRADYIRIYNAIEDHYKKNPAPSYRAPSAVITGQPGVGKSFWIYYALRRRLAERKPVIWYNSGKCYLFVDEGVYQIPPDFPPLSFKTFVWTLVDSDESKDGVPPNLVPHETCYYVIYSTSPNKQRWSRLHKTTRVTRIVMNPWTRGEILRAASLLLPDIPEDQINRTYDVLGPTPRLCLELILDKTQQKQYEVDVNKTILSVTAGQLENIIRNTASLTMDEVSHKICLISREDRNDVYSQAVVAPITLSVQSKLANQFRNLEQAERIRLYNYLAKVPDSRATAGIFFEAAAQRRLQDGINLELFPMVRLTTSRKGRWHSSHGLLRNASLEAFRQQALQERLPVTVAPSRTVEYPDAEQLIAPNVFYVPQSTNQVALDSFIIIDGLLYLFQFTIASVHDIKPGLANIVKNFQGLPTMDKWRFVFIITPSSLLKVPLPKLLKLRELEPYSAVIQFDS